MSWPLKALIISIVLIGQLALADCTSPAGVVGTFRYIVNTPVGTVKFCNGTTWDPTETSDTAVSCTVPGTIRYNSTPTPKRLEFCGGNTVSGVYTWRSTNGTTTGAGGACSPVGKFEYNSGIGGMRFCDDGTYRIAGTVAAATITTNPANGLYSCAGSGAVVSMTVTNTGGSATSAISVTLGGASPGAYSIISNSCTTLAASASCGFDVIYPTSGAGPNIYATVAVSATTGGTSTINLETDVGGNGCMF